MSAREDVAWLIERRDLEPSPLYYSPGLRAEDVAWHTDASAAMKFRWRATAVAYLRGVLHNADGLYVAEHMWIDNPAALAPHIDAEIAAAVAKREAEIVAWLRAIDTANEIVNLTCPMYNSDTRDALLTAAKIIERRGDHRGEDNG